LSVAQVWQHRHRLPIAGADPWDCIRPSEWLAIVGEPSPSAMIDALDDLPRFQTRTVLGVVSKRTTSCIMCSNSFSCGIL
jgi:hypothetical protein